MGTHGVSGYQEFFLGSNSFRVVTASSIPVLTVQCHAHKVGFNNIVLPIDGSKNSREKVSHAAAIATAYDATVHIAGLITKKHRKKEPIFNVKIKQVEDFLNKKGIKHTRRIVHGKDLANMTIDVAKEVDACLTVIMTEQEGSSGLFMGPFAQRIVNHSEVPILSVTPKKIVEKFSQNGSYHSF
jgi:nucleotide-binding universal stress UspA family protein